MLTAAERYSRVIGGGAVPSLADADTLAAADGFSLPAIVLQDLGKLTRDQVICSCMFGVPAAIVGKVLDFVFSI